jgi:hypothetical protein
MASRTGLTRMIVTLAGRVQMREMLTGWVFLV